MTQDDVDLIYDYLHENYEYRDGELIRKFKCRKSGRPKGVALGSFFIAPNRATMRAVVSINGEKTSKPLSHFIYLFHNKIFPDFIDHINKNTMDCAIENLKTLTRKDLESQKTGFRGYEQIKTVNGIRFRVSITTKENGRAKKIHLGSYDSEKEAHMIYIEAKNIFIKYPDEQELKIKLKEIFPNIRIKINKNKLNFPGVHKNKNYFKSSICVNGNVKYLGSFKTAQEAHEAYLQAKDQYKK